MVMVRPPPSAPFHRSHTHTPAPARRPPSPAGAVRVAVGPAARCRPPSRRPPRRFPSARGPAHHVVAAAALGCRISRIVG
eukprot:6054004-Pyramimonas_sp.AAC.1